MATLKELEAQEAEMLSSLQAIRARIKKLKESIKVKKQAACDHSKTRVVSERGYFEAGKMSAPLPDTRYLTCCLCDKRLSVEVSKGTEFRPL